MAGRTFTIGDKVAWNSTQGSVTGTVKKKLTAPIDIKSHHVDASPDNPQWLVQSAGTGQIAAHKATALKPAKGVKAVKAAKATKATEADKSTP